MTQILAQDDVANSPGVPSNLPASPAYSEDVRIGTAELWGLVWRNRFYVFLTIAALVGITALALTRAPKEYVAQATIVLHDTAMEFDPRNAQLELNQITASRFLSEIDVIRSTEFAELAAVHVGAALGGITSIEEDPAALRATYAPVGDPNSRAIEIHARHTDAATTAAIANGVAEAYIARSLEMQQSSVEAALEHFSARRTALGAEIRARQAELASFINEEGLTDRGRPGALHADLAKANSTLALLTDATSDTDLRLREELTDQRDAIEAELLALTAASLRRQSMTRHITTLEDLESETIEQVSTLQNQLVLAEPNADQVTLATIPSEASFPNWNTSLSGAAVGGLVLGFILSLMRESLDSRIRRSPASERALGVPVFGRIPRLPRRYSKAPAGLVNRLAMPGDRFVRAFRTVSTSLNRQAEAKGGSIVMIASERPRDGRSTVALGLAGAAAGEGERALLIDLSGGRDGLARQLGAEPSAKSFAALLENPFDLRREIHAVGGGHLSVLAPAVEQGVSLRIGASPEQEDTLKYLRKSFDLIVIDPPSMQASDTACRAGIIADVVAVLGRYDVSVPEHIQAATSRLRLCGIDPAGVVLNDA